MAYPDVIKILDEQYRWFVEPSARPAPDPVNRAVNEGRSDETIASQLTAYAKRFPPPPPGYPYQDPDGIWGYQLYHCYGGGAHFAITNTNIALGYAEEDPPLPKVPAAHLAEQAWEIALQGWYYIGDTRFLDMTTPEGQAEMAARLEFAKILPASWDGVSYDLYRYFVVIGKVLREVPAFGVAQVADPRDWYGFNVQKYLDNEWAVRQMLPAPWGPGGVRQ